MKQKAAKGELPKFLELATNFKGEECLFWPFARSSDGGARITIKGKQYVVARLICIAVHGLPPTKKHQAAHSCGNGHLGCVNNKHLRWATQSENEKDKIKHGTYQYGANNPSAKVTSANVVEIRERYSAGGVLQRQLAKQFGLTQATISDIVRCKNWRHL